MEYSVTMYNKKLVELSWYIAYNYAVECIITNLQW